MRPVSLAVRALALLLLVPALGQTAPKPAAKPARVAKPKPPEKDRALAAVRSYREAHGAQILGDFSDLLAIPNVSGDTANIARNVAYLKDALSRRGLTMEVWESPGASPVLYGKLVVPGAKRTLGFYAHYDGQPVDSEKWVYPPFSPTLLTAASQRTAG